MTKAKLLWNIEAYRKGRITDEQIVADVDAYSAALLQQTHVSGSLPSREDAYKEGLSRKRRHEKNIVWKAKIFAAGAMWAKMKLTGISDVIGNDR